MVSSFQDIDGNGGYGEDNDDEGTALVGLTLTNDGTIISATKGGIVTAIRMGPEGQLIPISTLDLRAHVEFPRIHISNSISVHDTGIFIGEPLGPLLSFDQVNGCSANLC